MKDPAAGIVLCILGMLFIGVIAFLDGTAVGRREEWCRFSFDTASTAADSLAISRKDARCAQRLQNKEHLHGNQ